MAEHKIHVVQKANIYSLNDFKDATQPFYVTHSPEKNSHTLFFGKEKAFFN